MGNSPFWRENSPGLCRESLTRTASAPWNCRCPMCLSDRPRGSALSNVSPPVVDKPGRSELASQFRLTPGQIHDAAAWVAQRRAMASDEAEVTRAELYAACRNQSHHKLAELAVKIEPHYTWDDLVLPADKRRAAQRALRPGGASPARLWRLGVCAQARPWPRDQRALCRTLRDRQNHGRRSHRA